MVLVSTSWYNLDLNFWCFKPPSSWQFITIIIGNGHKERKVKLLSHVWLSATPWTVAYQTPPWDSPGKKTGVGCHFFLQAFRREHRKIFTTLGWGRPEVINSDRGKDQDFDCHQGESSVHPENIFTTSNLQGKKIMSRILREPLHACKKQAIQ